MTSMVQRWRYRPSVSSARASRSVDASAEEIAGLYRQRWAIELFFRWVCLTQRKNSSMAQRWRYRPALSSALASTDLDARAEETDGLYRHRWTIDVILRRVDPTLQTTPY